jgi:hypothetical protein
MTEYGTIPNSFNPTNTPRKPSIFQSIIDSGNGISTYQKNLLDQQDSEAKLIVTLNSLNFRNKEADKFAVESMFGKVSFKDVIPPSLTRYVVESVGYLDQERGLRAMYIATCSSLYYQTTHKEISLKKAREEAAKIHSIFKGQISRNSSSIPDGGWINIEYKPEIEKYSESHPDDKIPDQLLRIIDFPLTAQEEFNQLFDSFASKQ